MVEKFINPYNFISFPKRKAAAYTDEDKHTGVIEYTITTKTPLFIPNSSSETAFKESDTVKDHKSYDFFSYTELDSGKRYENQYHIPVIPGSEMRGVVRNVYETLTDSCMGILNSEEYPVKRTPTRFNAGLLCRNGDGTIVLRSAESSSIGEKAFKGEMPRGFEKNRNGDEIKGKGYLLKWGMGVKKVRYHVFSLKNVREKGTLFSRDEIERKLLPVINSYLDQPALKDDNQYAYKEYKEDLENFLQGKGGMYFPVNYSTLANGVIYLSPATITKEASNNSVGMLAGAFSPCKEDFCPACDLFGHIGNNNDSKGSRIRFTDLYVTEKKEAKEYYLCDKKTLQALGGPKLGNTEFYLKRPDGATFWTYDYNVRNGRINVEPGELRGRKYYWHSRDGHIIEAEASKLNKTVRPVKAEVAFCGKLYFEGISKKQLNQLIWILNSGSEKLGLKLGSGKPLGLGSVSCNVVQITERKIEVKNGMLEYAEVPSDINVTYEAAEFSSSVKEEFYKIAGLDSIPENMEITYPKDFTQKNKAIETGFSWFVENHETVSGKKWASGREDIKIKRVLPKITSKELGMPYGGQEKHGNNFRGKNNSNQSNFNAGFSKGKSQHKGGGFQKGKW